MKSWEVEQLIRDEAQAEGFAEGHAKGHAKGFAEGHAEGHVDGMKETLRAIELKRKGFDSLEALMEQGISELIATEILTMD